MTIRHLAIGVVAIVVLLITHWFTYNSGFRHSLDKDAPRRENVQGIEPYSELLFEVNVLRVAAKCPEGFSKEELHKWRNETQTSISRAESTTLDYARRSGDEGLEDRVRKDS